MLYLAYERQADLLQVVRTAARSALSSFSPWDRLTGHPLRYAAAANALLARAGLSHQRPAFGVHAVLVGNREVSVTEEAISATPFGTLLHFKKDLATPQPRMLVVAPLSGHFATLLRNTGHAARRPRPLHHRLAQRPRRQRGGRRLRLRRLYRSPDPLPRRDRARSARPRRLPALRAGACGRRPDGGGREHGAALQHDPDGRPGRRAGQPHQSERTRD